MKKKTTLILALALIAALFAGCGSGAPAVPVPSDTDTAPTALDTADSAQPTDDSPYHFAAGKYDVDERGFPTSSYEYDLPISTTDEVLTFWTVVWTPQYVDEEGYGSMPFAQNEHDLTGVNIEYDVISSDTRAENFSVLLASDNLDDLSSQASYFYTGGTLKSAILDDHWFINIYDYKDYCPNYIYEATKDPEDTNIYETVFYEDNLITSFYSMLKEAMIASNYMTRGDWLEDFGMTGDDIVTFGQLHDYLLRVKNEVDTCEYPWPMFSSIDIYGTWSFAASDTLPAVSSYIIPVYVIDGKATLAHMNDSDKDFISMIQSWFKEGLINPNWLSFTDNTAFHDLTTTGQVAYLYCSPGEVTDYETLTTNDPDATWVPLHKPLKTADQTVHMGNKVSRISYGSTMISAKCENIPLAVSWCDWRYSQTGSFAVSYGKQGYLWDYDEDGNVTATNWALNNPSGIGYAWLCMLYGLNSLAEHGMEDGMRKYAYPGGERLAEIHAYWKAENNDGAWDWPEGVNFTDDQTERVNVLLGDIGTYVQENYLAFADGSKPMSDWDSYIAGLKSMGIDDLIAVYQDAYDGYAADKST